MQSPPSRWPRGWLDWTDRELAVGVKYHLERSSFDRMKCWAKGPSGSIRSSIKFHIGQSTRDASTARRSSRQTGQKQASAPWIET